MNDERWYDLTEQIRERFKVTLDTERPLDPGPGKIEEMEFEGPTGRLRLERVTRPVVIERRARFSKRTGGQTTEEFVYSKDEFSHRVTFYRWVDGAWEEQDYRGMIGPR